jgi:hypothetical protein
MIGFPMASWPTIDEMLAEDADFPRFQASIDVKLGLFGSEQQVEVVVRWASIGGYICVG